jgi:hypothetical protein
MTATEVLERSLEMARLLGATYGRLQSELLTPLANRAVAILQRRGEVGRFEIDGRGVEMIYTSPLARHRRQREAGMVRDWINAVTAMGPEAQKLIDPLKTSRYLAAAFGVPEDILRTDAEISELPENVPPVPDLGAGGDLMGMLADLLGSDAPPGDAGAVEPAPVETAEAKHVQ